MRDFRMKLEPEKRLLAMAHGSNGRAVGCCYNLKIRRHRSYFIAMAHPDIQLRNPTAQATVFNIIQQSTARDDVNLREAKFGFIRGLNPAAEFLGHGLHAVADAEYRQAGLIEERRRSRRDFGIRRFRTAGKNNPLGREGGKVVL